MKEYDYYRFLTADTNNGVLEYDDCFESDDCMYVGGDDGEMFESYLATLTDHDMISAWVTKEVYDRIKDTYGIHRQ